MCVNGCVSHAHCSTWEQSSQEKKKKNTVNSLSFCVSITHITITKNNIYTSCYLFISQFKVQVITTNTQSRIKANIIVMNKVHLPVKKQKKTFERLFK